MNLTVGAFNEKSWPLPSVVTKGLLQMEIQPI